MKDQPIRDERMIEALEVRRPGCDDSDDPAMVRLAEQLAADPELAEMAERLIDVDAAIGNAFRDVDVPEGFEQRLVECLAAAEKPEPAAPSGAVPKRRSRRWLLAGSTLGTIAAGLLVAFFLGWFDDEGLDRDMVLSRGIDFFMQDTPELGYLIDGSEPRPMSPAVVSVPGRATWRPVHGFLGHKGVAFDLVGPGGAQATLYVIRHEVDGLRQTSPPPSPMANTGGCCVSAWQEGKLLYVLVVQGNAENDYPQFLKYRAGVIT